MNILQVSASYKPAFIYGGPVISVADLCEMLAEAGDGVNVFTTTANGTDELPVHDSSPVLVNGVPVLYFKRQTGDHTHFSFALLVRLWKHARRYDVIHIHSWWNTVAVFSCLISLIRKRTVVVSPRGMLSDYSFGNRNNFIKSVIHQFLGKYLLKRCILHATSESEKDDLLQFAAPENIKVIPNLLRFPQNRFAFRKVEPGAVFQLLFFSRIEEKKGLDILFRALSKSTIPYMLTIAGSGDDSYIARLKKLAFSLGISEKLTWVGRIDHNEKFQYIHLHDLLVLPSFNENFANVVIESLASGTPVLVSKGVALSSYISQTGFGWVCEAEIESLRASLEVAYLDTEKRNFMRELAPEQVRADFNEDDLLREYRDFYHNLHHATV